MMLQGTGMENAFQIIQGDQNNQSFQLGDYVFGSLDQIITRIMNQTGNQGPPPTSKKVIEKLPVYKLEKDLNDSCPVCKDELKKGEEAMKLPCNHEFHKECLMPWLERANTCPICRKELETDDQDYEKRKKESNQGNNGNNSNNRPPPNYFV